MRFHFVNYKAPNMNISSSHPFRINGQPWDYRKMKYDQYQAITNNYLNYKSGIVDNSIHQGGIPSDFDTSRIYNYRVPTYFDNMELSKAAWEKNEQIQSSDGWLVGFDTETLGDVGFKSADPSLQRMSAITEIGFGAIPFQNGEPQDAQRVGFLFGINPEQKNELERLIESYRAGAVISSNSTEASTLQRLSVYADAKIRPIQPSELDFMKSLGFDTSKLMGANVVEHLGKGSNDIADIEKGLKVLGNVYKDSAIGTKYGNTMFQELMTGIQKMSEASNISLVGANVGFDISALKAQGNRFGFSFDVTKDKFADIQDPRRTLVYGTNSSQLIDITRTAKENNNPIKNSLNSIGGVSALLEANGIQESEYHQADMDALDELRVSMLTTKNGRRLYPEAKEIHENAMKERFSQYGTTLSPDQNRLFYFAKDADLDPNNLDVYEYGGQRFNRGTTKGRYFRLTSITEADGMFSDAIDVKTNKVDANGVSHHGFYMTFEEAATNIEKPRKFYKFIESDETDSSFDAASDYLKRHTTIRTLGKEISQSDVNRETIVQESDWARREWDRMFTPNSITSKSNGMDHGGYHQYEQYYSLYERLNEAVPEIKANDVMLHKYDDVLLSLDEGMSDYELTTFDAMYGRLNDEYPIYQKIKKTVEAQEHRTNYTDTMIASEMHQVVSDYEKTLGSEKLNIKQRGISIQDQFSVDFPLNEDAYVKMNYNGSPEQVASALKNRFLAEYGDNAGANRAMVRNLKNAERRGLVSEKFVEDMEQAVSNPNALNPYYVADAITQEINKEIIDPLRQSNMTQRDIEDIMERLEEYHADPEIQSKHLEEFLQDPVVRLVDAMHETDTVYSRSHVMRSARYYGSNYYKEKAPLGRLVLEDEHVVKKMEEAGQNAADLARRFSFDRELNIKAIADKLDYTDSQYTHLSQEIFFGGSKTSNPYGLFYQKNLRFGILDPENEKTGSLLLVVTHKDDVNNALEVIKNTNIKGYKDAKENLKDAAAVIELPKFKRLSSTGAYHADGSPIDLIVGSQSDSGYPKIMGNSLEFYIPGVEDWRLTKSLDAIKGGIENDSDRVLASYRMIAGNTLLPYIENKEYSKATRVYRRHTDRLYSPEASFSGFQTLIQDVFDEKTGTFVKKPFKMGRLNKSDMIKASNTQLKELGDLMVPLSEVSQKGEHRNLIDDLLHYVNDAIGKVDTQNGTRTLLPEDKIRIISDPQFSTFFWQHLFHDGIMDDDIFNGYQAPKEAKLLEGKSIWDLIYARKDDFSPDTNRSRVRKALDEINYHYANGSFAQQVKETDAAKGIVSFANTYHFGTNSFIESNTRPTFIQQFTAKYYMDAGKKQEKLGKYNFNFGYLYRSKEAGELFETTKNANIALGVIKDTDDIADISRIHMRQMSSYEIRGAYRSITDTDIRQMAKENHVNYKKLKSTLQLYEHMDTYESKAIGHPVVFNTLADNMQEALTFNHSNIVNLKESDKKLSMQLIRENDYKVTDGFLFGRINQRPEIYHGIDITFQSEEEMQRFFETGKGYAIPLNNRIGTMKAIHGTEKETVEYPIFTTQRANDMSAALKITGGNQEEAETLNDLAFNMIFNSYRNEKGELELFEQSIRATVINDLETKKHLTGGFTFSKMYEIMEAYKKEGRQNELIHMLNENGFKDFRFQFNNGVFEYDSHALSNEGAGVRLDTFYQRFISGTITNTSDPMIQGLLHKFEMEDRFHITYSTMATPNINESLGVKRIISERTQQMMHMDSVSEELVEGVTGMRYKGSLTPYNEVILSEWKDRQVNPRNIDIPYKKELGLQIAEKREIDARKHFRRQKVDEQRTITGMGLAVKYAQNPSKLEELVKRDDVIELNFEDIKTFQQGKRLDYETVQSSLFGIGDTPSAFIRSMSEINNVDPNKVSAAVIHTGLNLKVGDTTTEALVIPLQSIQPNNGDLNLVNSQSAASGVLQELQSYFEAPAVNREASLGHVAQKAENFYLKVADDLSGKRGSYMYRANQIVLPNSAQVLAGSSEAPLLEEFFSKEFVQLNEAEKKKAIDSYAARIRNGEVLDIPTKYQYKDVVKRIVNGKEKLVDLYGNVVYFSKESLETQFNLDFGLIGKQVYLDLQEHNNKLVKYAAPSDFGLHHTFSYEAAADKIVEKYFAATQYTLNKNNLIASVQDRSVQLARQYDDDIKQITDPLSRRVRQMQFLKDKKVLNDLFEDLGMEYMSTVGMVGGGVRPPVFQLGAFFTTRILLDPNRHGNNDFVMPWTLKLLKRDHDGDNIIYNIVANPYGGLAHKNDMLYRATLGEMRHEEETRNNVVFASMLENGVELESSSISETYQHIENVFKTYNPELYERLSEEAKATGDKSLLIDAVIQYDRQHGNQFRSKVAMLNDAKARITHNNIGYISNISKDVRDVLLDMHPYMEHDDWVRTVKALSSVNDPYYINTGILSVLEQKGIDTKQMRHGSTARSSEWRQAIDYMFSENADDRTAVDKLLRASEAIFFGEDRQYDAAKYAEDIVSKSWKELQDEGDDVFARILQEQGAKAAKDAAEPYYWKSRLRIMLDFSKDKQAKQHYKRLIVTRKTNNVWKRLIEKGEAFSDPELQTMTKISQQSAILNRVAKVNAGAVSEKFKINNGRMLFISKATTQQMPYGYVLKSFNPNTNTAVFQRYVLSQNGLRKSSDNNDLKVHARTGEELNNRLDSLFYDMSFSKMDFEQYPKERGRILYKVAKESQEDLLNRMTVSMFQLSDQEWNDEIFGDLLSYINKNPESFGPSGSKLNRAILDQEGIGLRSLFATAKKEDLIAFKKQLEYIKYVARRMPEGEAEDLLRSINHHIVANGQKQKSYSDYFKTVVDTMVGGDEILGDQVRKAATNVPDNFNFAKYASVTDDLRKIPNIGDTLLALQAEAANKGLAKEQMDELVKDTKRKLFQKKNTTVKESLYQLESLFESNEAAVKFFGLDQTPTGNTRVGFGRYTGLRFADLDEIQISEILNVKKLKGAYQKEMGPITISALNEYIKTHADRHVPRYRNVNVDHEMIQSQLSNFTDQIASTVEDSLNAKETISDSTSAFRESTEKAVKEATKEGEEALKNEAGQTARKSSGLKKKLLSTFVQEGEEDIFSRIKYRNVGIAMGALAAIGLVNNLVLNHKSASPLVPDTKERENEQNEVNVSHNQIAPATKLTGQKNIYVDPTSGTAFKVSAKTNQLLNNQQNIKMLRESGVGGSLNIKTINDNSNVTENWLQRRFEEIFY